MPLVCEFLLLLLCSSIQFVPMLIATLTAATWMLVAATTTTMATATTATTATAAIWNSFVAFASAHIPIARK